MSYRKTILILCLSIFLSAERNVNAQVKTVNFSYTGAVQKWTVPSCVAYITIVATGAQGGNTGGMGASVQGVFNSAPGHVMDIVVGQAGLLGNGGNGGGGGASYVWDANTTTLFAAAAGGGGYSSNGGSPPGPGSGTTTPTNGGGSGSGAGGVSGSGGAYGAKTGNGADGVGGGGAGWLSNGGTNPNILSEGEGQGGFYPLSNVTPAGGGAAGNANGNAGGYGGGGGSSGASGASGGGGGYNGGGGGNAWSGSQWGSGGGGGSYNGGTNQVNTSGTNSGNGTVKIMFATDSVGSALGNNISNIICSGNATGKASVLVNGAPGGPAFTYSWTPNVSTTDTATGLLAGTYKIIVTGCGSASATVTITQPGFFVANPTVNEIQCYGGTGSITAGAIGGTGPYTYVFTPGGNVSFINNLGVGTYSLNVLDNRGCASSDLITISQPSPLSIKAYSTDSVICYGQTNGSATAAVSGGTYPYTYLWAPSGGTYGSASGLGAATYTLNVTDNHGCVSTGTANITQPNPLAVIVNPPLYNLACNGDNNGVLGSGVTGGVRPYTYAWTGNAGIDSNAGNLSAGTYTLSVTDGHGCVTKQTAIVTQPAALVLSIDSTFNGGSCSGTAWVVLNGGVQPYTYLWSNGSKKYFQDSLCDGLYCCTVTDANGCIHNICTRISSDLGVGSVTSNTGKINIYPNPSNGHFTIESSISGSAWSIEVYNVLGEKVYTQSNIQTPTSTMDMSNQTNGVYLYRIISNTNGNLLSEGKLVLQK